MTDKEVEDIIRSNMNLQMNLAGIRADFEEKLRRTWVGLTDEEIFDVWINEIPAPDKVFYQKLCRSVEAKLKEKNT